MDSPTPDNQQPNPLDGPGSCSTGCAVIFLLAGLTLPMFHLLGGWFESEILFVSVLIGWPAFLVCHLLALISIARQQQGRSLGGIVLVVVWSAIGLAIAMLLATGALREFQHWRDKAGSPVSTGAAFRAPAVPPDGPASWQAPVEFVTA